MATFGPVAVMDSGIGGLPYLESCRALLPGLPFIYLADREGFPYGPRSREEVESIVVDRVRRLVDAWKPRAIVIACNTASQAALAAVRTDNPGIPVIGTVPAIKPAAERGNPGSIGVLATERTISDPYLDDLVATHAAGRRVARRAAPELVSFVETEFVASSPAERRSAVLPHVEFLVDAGVGIIVLACTHFLHIAQDIADCASELAALRGLPPIDVIDSREGVAHRLYQVLDEGRALEVADPAEASAFLLTGDLPFEPCYGLFARHYRLAGPFALPRRRE